MGLEGSKLIYSAKMRTINFKVEVFRKKYQQEVIDLVDYELKSWKVLPTSNSLITDEDLYHLDEIYRGKNRFWVAILRGKVIGTVGIRGLSAIIAKISRMYVYDRYHGKGVGQKLLETAILFAEEKWLSRAEENGYKKLELNSEKLLTRSHNFYKRNGFRITGEKGERFHFEMSFDKQV